MNPFALARPRNFDEASELLMERRWSLPVLKAGGLDVLDHMKEGLMEPDLLVDVRTLRPADMEQNIELGPDRTMRIAGSTTLAEIAASEARRWAPALAGAAGSAATPQVRNVATAAGNLLQRPRCWYYRAAQFDCRKKGGDTCFAQSGENEYHAIFGNRRCAMVHPSNLAPALMVLDGSVEVTGGSRTSIDMSDFYVTPEQDISREDRLEAGEVITAINLKCVRRSGFYAIKQKKSFDWPMAFAAVSLDMDGDGIASARVCAGAVAPVPMRLPDVEAALVGVDPANEAALDRACRVAARGARPLTGNAYKATLLPVAVKRAVLDAARMGERDRG